MRLSGRFVLGRLLWTGVASWLFLTAAFLALAFTPDPNEVLRMYGAMGSGGGEAQEAAEAYQALRGRDRPLLARYVGWLLAFATLEFGYSFAFETPVTDVLATTVPRTLAYLVPGVVLGSAASLVLGTVASLRGGLADRVVGGASYVALALPAFAAARLLVIGVGPRGGGPVPAVLVTYDAGAGLLAPGNLAATAVPAALVAANIFAAATVWVRQETAALAGAAFVKTLRATGAGQRTVGRRIVHNAVAPLTSLLVTEVVVVLLVTMYVVEVVVGYPGFGFASYVGFQERDFGLVLVSVVGLVVATLLATTAQQVAAALLDPRVADDGGDRA